MLHCYYLGSHCLCKYGTLNANISTNISVSDWLQIKNTAPVEPETESRVLTIEVKRMHCWMEHGIYLSRVPRGTLPRYERRVALTAENRLHEY